MSTTIKDGRIIEYVPGIQMEIDHTGDFRNVLTQLATMRIPGKHDQRLLGRTSQERVIMLAQDLANEFGWFDEPDDRRLLRYRSIGYTAEECEREMRRLTNGERGCSNPDEHEGSSSPHMAIDR